jgi:radical SAM superfamily enzyme YgiQ (UPF0313 family)
MKQLKVLIVNPTSHVWRVREGGRPRGSRLFRYSMLPSLYVAAAMPPYVTSRIVDEDVEPIDFDTDADLVGISFMTFNAPRAYEIADRFRREKGKAVIFGGYHPTFMPEEAIEYADAICIGEAEPNVPRMIEDFAAGKLQPFYDNGLADLSGLPIPNRRLIRGTAYATPDVLQATRGCKFRCSFCSIAKFSRYAHRTRPVEEVIAELQTLGRWVIFMDDDIVSNREYAKELFTRMIPLGKRWFSQCGIGIAYDQELLSLATRSGCCGMFIGFESLSQDSLGVWEKSKNRVKDYHRVIDNLHKAGIGVFAGFIFGSDNDDRSVFKTTLQFLIDAKIDSLQATRLTPFPGTPLFDEMERQGRIFDKDWSKYDLAHVVFEPRNMSPETLDKGVSWVMSQYYSRPEVTRRIWRAFGYLSPSVISRVVLPLNLGFRYRFKASGMFERAGGFSPEAAEQAVYASV